MIRIKAYAISIFAAIALSAIQFLAAMKISFNILWQVTLVQALAGPGPIIGYDVNRRPMYEGTPVHMVAAYLGLVLGVIVYSALIYKLIKSWHNHRVNRSD